MLDIRIPIGLMFTIMGVDLARIRSNNQLRMV